MKTSISIVLLLVISITTPISISKITSSEESYQLSMAANQPASSAASVYIVHTEQPSEGDDHEAYHLRTLSSVLGSEDAAKGSLIYVYKNAATGFSAKLTPEHVSQLKNQPGVLQIVADQPVHIESAGGV